MSELRGTWTGTLVGDGQQMPAVFRVADNGYPIYEYQTKSGTREAELTHVGQTLRFVPPDGGVATVVVDALMFSDTSINFALTLSVESTSRYGSEATLCQNRTAFLCCATLSGAELDVRMTITSKAVFSQPGMAIPGEEPMIVCEGRLQKQ